MFGPWITPSQLRLPAGRTLGDFPAGDPERWIDVASSILTRLSGRRYTGVAVDVWRPAGGGACGCAGGRAGCSRVSEIELPNPPVVEVVEILIDGDSVPAVDWRVDDWRWLVWTGAEGKGWPCCQRMERASTDVETWQVRYRFGQAPDIAAQEAAGMLAVQLLLSTATNPDLRKACELPQRVQQITRQGVSMVLLDPMKIITEGGTGLPFVDMWLASLRVEQTRRRAAIIDPRRVATSGRVGRRTSQQ